MNNELLLYCDRSAILRGLPCNEKIDEVIERLGEFRSRGVDVTVVDTTRMSEREIQDKYLRAVQPSVRKKYSVRQVFGSRSRSGWLFGRGVPALVVKSLAGETIADVFPHRESGRIITIHDAIESGESLA
jgi:hypothetical protein